MGMDKTFDAQAAEARIIAKWQQAGAFKAGAKQIARRELLHHAAAPECDGRVACGPCV